VKVGDLVTLSQYGMNLGTIPHHYRRAWHPDSPPLFGIITEIQEVNAVYQLSVNERQKYIVKWNVDDLTGRTYYGRYFYRNDLKYFRG